MQPRFVGRLGPADAMTVANAALGFAAAVAATIDPSLGARLILLAAGTDGLDGVIAEKYGGTPVGEFIDSLADVASFCVAPAVFVFSVASQEWGLTLTTADPPLALAASFLIPALFVGAGVVRLGMYTAYDIGSDSTEGVQTTLAATILAVVYLAGFQQAALLVALTAAFTYLMVTTITYPDLKVSHVMGMAIIQLGAIVAPTAFNRLFPRALLFMAVLYLIGPWFYRRYLV
ncbi:protein sorting system archaetidylserine synthase [Halorientalis brevis]|uniref:Protein sorting system archaetidylserine synthase n=1 Tax=Halorientalis brevis TaxID=1126241 RepID=A0ABD6CD34_9EURY|nr:protein sorting system archaetidylserine synthase [Halorientalis brevis]